ncbi:MAG TPA: GH3 auxin-responsive promoter family protein [Kofleriaceae bacterium]|nr:GH3 auxin-responsive promoter family protein [Kofleriaceae bacterium]
MTEGARTFAARAKAARARLFTALADARAEQTRQLRQVLERHADTAFGREHGFASIRSAADYRRAVPIRTYDELAPWVQRQIDGETNVLSSAPPVLYFSTTGTTGTPKHVPVTNEFLRRWSENLLAWWGGVLERHPEVADVDDGVVMLHLAPKPFARFTPTGIPIHVSTEMPTIARGIFPFTRARWFPPPSELGDADRLYYLLRASLESRLLGIACLHASRLQAAAAMLREHSPRMAREIHEGTMLGKPWGAPNPTRARELDRLLDLAPLTPRAAWPSLRFVSSWIGASFDLYRAEIERDYSDEMFPQMTVSSEVGHMTMPLATGVADGPLTVHTNYYEFRSADAPEADDRTLEAHELEVGGVYEIVVTTCSGLYRYSCGDQFRVARITDGVPVIDFVGRRGVSDLAGEKITEQHAMAALRAGAAELPVVNATFVATWARPARYVLVVEPVRPWSAAECARFTGVCEAALRTHATRYDLKRSFGDLGTLEVRPVPRGTFDRYRETRVARGIPGTQLKDKLLHFHYEAAVLDALGPTPPSLPEVMLAPAPPEAPRLAFTTRLCGAEDRVAALEDTLRGAKAWLELASIEALLDDLLAGHPACRAAFTADDRIDHVGFLLPLWSKELLSPAASAAGFPLAHRAFPSSLITRELGRMIGQRRLPTQIFKAHGRTTGGDQIAFEAFLPDTDDARVEEWIRLGACNHIALRIATPDRFPHIRDAFAAAGFAMARFMYERPVYLPGEDATIQYFDLDNGEHPFRLEVRAAGEIT